MSPANLAARAGAWSASHRRRAIVGWLVFVILAAVIGGAIGTKIDTHEGSGESGRVDTFLRAHLPESSTENILISARHGRVADQAAFAPAVRALVARVDAVPHVFDVRGPAQPNHISKDGRSALVSLELGTKGHIDSLLAATHTVAGAYPSLRIEEFGDASANKAINDALGHDFQRAETLSLPITLAILLLAFGSLVAAGLPMLLGLTAVGGTLGLIGLVSQLLPMDGAINSVVLLIGLAVGVDYSLFYLRREREERARGASDDAALRAAAATSGHAIVVSGLTVIIAMAGMFLAGSRVFASFAVGTIMVVAVAVVGSVTVLPALLSALGPRVDKGRIPFVHRLASRRRRGRRGAWARILDVVIGRPKTAALLSTGVLVALAIPALNMRTSLPGSDAIPKSLPIMQTYARLQAAFPGGPSPAVVGVLAPDVRAPQVQRTVSSLIAQAGRTPGLLKPVTVTPSRDHRVVELSIPLAGKGTDARSNAAMSRLRGLVHGEFAGQTNVQAGVTGQTAGTVDFNTTMDSHLVYVFAFVLGMAFLLLALTFDSIVIPLQAIVLNLLSVAAAYGLLVFVFQDGHLHGLLGFSGTSAITSWLPLFLFVVLFGLSMDYHVFILSRVREGHDRGLEMRAAVTEGLRRTAGVVTSAALVMVGVFGIFGTLSMIEFKQMGVGLAAAILIDATIIRGVLLPSTLTLLGERAWYRPLRRRAPQVSRDTRMRDGSHIQEPISVAAPATLPGR
jgi:RND superfamily putative drug exporter